MLFNDFLGYWCHIRPDERHMRFCFRIAEGNVGTKFLGHEMNSSNIDDTYMINGNRISLSDQDEPEEGVYKIDSGLVTWKFLKRSEEDDMPRVWVRPGI